MTVERTRAFRRHQRERIRERYRKMIARWGTFTEEPPPRNRFFGGGLTREQFFERQVHLYASTHGKPCSCWMCGNQRRVCGPTIQERRAESVDFWRRGAGCRTVPTKHRSRGGRP